MPQLDLVSACCNGYFFGMDHVQKERTPLVFILSNHKSCYPKWMNGLRYLERLSLWSGMVFSELFAFD